MTRFYPKPVVFLFLFFLGLVPALATHITGTEITYQYLDSNRYEVTYVFYRSCGGVKFQLRDVEPRVACLGGAKGSGDTLSLKLKAITRIKTSCTKNGSQCGSVVNTAFAGSGTEKFVYTTIVDFDKAPFNKYGGSGCTKVRFDVSACCRNSGVNTGSANTIIYNYASLDLANAKGNSSPKFHLDPMLSIRGNQPWYMNLGAMDTIDHDSLSYTVGLPLKAYGDAVKYMDHTAVDCYYPATLKYPFKKADANPPIGLTLDPVTGNWICTPVRLGQFTPVIVEVHEWGRDTSGNRIEKSVTRREFIVSTIRSDNNTPEISGIEDYVVCEEDSVYFTLTTRDAAYQPPPPNPKVDPDTTHLRWVNPIDQAEFKLSRDTTSFQSGDFLWAPKRGDARNNPYVFVFEVSDNNCVNPVKQQRAISVRVKPRTYGASEVTSLSCGKHALEARWDSMSPKPVGYVWTVYDLKTGEIDTSRKQSKFMSNGRGLSNARIDTVDIRKDGSYIIELTINNASGCGTKYRDTIHVSSRLEVTLIDSKDTFLCKGNSIVFRPKVSNGTASSYTWNTGATSDSLVFNMADSLSWSPVRLDISNGSCTAWDSIVVFNRPLPTLKVPQVVMSCVGDTTLLVAHGEPALWTNPLDTAAGPRKQGSTLNYEWIAPGKVISTDTAYLALYHGPYYVSVQDSLGCVNRDTIVYSRYFLNMPPDMEICYDAENINLNPLADSVNPGGKWSCPGMPEVVKDSFFLVDQTQVGAGASRRFGVNYTYDAPNGKCSAVDSFVIKVNPLPYVELRDGHFCQGKGLVNLKDDKIIRQPAGGALALGRQAWRCINCGTYDESKLIEDTGSGLPGAPQNFVININDTVMPLGSKKSAYIDVEMRFRNVFGCFNQDTTRINVVDKARINRNNFALHSPDEPYKLCESDTGIFLGSNVNDGTWWAKEPGVVTGNRYYPNKAKPNNYYFLYYTNTFKGCNSSDSVLVMTHPMHILNAPNDTSVTAFQDPTVINLKASQKNGGGINWLSLVGGTLDLNTGNKVSLTMPGGNDTVRRFIVLLFTDETTNNVCPFVDDNVQIFLHPTPCTDIVLKYDITGKILRAEPSNPNLEKFSWTFGSKSSVEKNPVFDVSDYPGNVALIELHAENGLGDTCTSRKWINLNNGSIEDLDKPLFAYPNPVEGGFFVDLPKGSVWSLVIVDMQGRKVLEQKMETNYVDCSSLLPGQYTYKVRLNNRLHEGRFVKLKNN